MLPELYDSDYSKGDGYGSGADYGEIALGMGDGHGRGVFGKDIGDGFGFGMGLSKGDGDGYGDGYSNGEPLTLDHVLIRLASRHLLIT